MSSAKCSEIASAINSILHLDPRDQSSLLLNIEDYFTKPCGDSDESGSDSDSDGQTEVEQIMEGTLIYYKAHKTTEKYTLIKKKFIIVFKIRIINKKAKLRY